MGNYLSMSPQHPLNGRIPHHSRGFVCDQAKNHYWTTAWSDVAILHYRLVVLITFKLKSYIYVYYLPVRVGLSFS